MKQRDLLLLISQTVRRVVPDAEIILYGSVARGEETPDSDIDLLILIEGNEDKPSMREINAITWPLYDLEWRTGINISPKIKTRKQWTNPKLMTELQINIINEGIRL